MNLEQIECFMSLAQRLNFTQAAGDLYMAQPALSRTIAALEKELGVQLFYRSPRSVTLTPAGRAFWKECPAILDSYRRSVGAAQRAQKGYQGEVVLGVLRDKFDPRVADLYQAMEARYPEIQLTLREYSHSRLMRGFLDGELDAIVNFSSEEQPPEVESLTMHRDRQCVAVPRQSPLGQERSLRMEDLKGERFVAMSRTASQPGHDFLRCIAAEAGFVPNVVAEADYIPSLLMMVACGIGITTLTDDLEHLARGRVIFVPLVGVPLSAHSLNWRRGNPNPSLPFLVETAREMLSQGI